MTYRFLVRTGAIIGCAFLTLSTSALIAYRLWKINKETARLLELTELWVAPIIRILLESAMLFSATIVATAATWGSNGHAETVTCEIVRDYDRTTSVVAF